MTGLFFGTQQLQLSSSLILHDAANRLKAHISFDNSGGTAVKRFKKCEDKKANMYGLVYKYDSTKSQKIDASV
jgi:long-subunit fatty acid transport protein